MADPAQPSSLPLGMLATVGATAYIVGRYTKKDGDSPLPSITALAMTYVVFRGLDFLWPAALSAVNNTTLPLDVAGLAQQAARNAPVTNGLSSLFSSASRATVDGYSVK